MTSAVLDKPQVEQDKLQGHCSICKRVWTLKERRGVCQWCGKLASYQSPTDKPRHIKSSRSRKERQAPAKGYEHLTGRWATFYNVASRFAGRAAAQDREDLLHDIMMSLANVERNNGHNPFTEAVMYRIASRRLYDYWRTQYTLNNGLDCQHCTKSQQAICKRLDLYRGCPKAVKLEYLETPIIDGEGNLTEIGELIADDTTLDLAAWTDINTFLQGCPNRLIDIAGKIQDGETLTQVERNYLCRFRQREQKSLF